MALPTTIITGGHFPGHAPPFISSAGNVYAFIQTIVTANVIMEAYKATDPTSSWAVQDSENGPTTTSSVGTFESVSIVQLADLLYVASFALGDYRFSIFNMATDAWTTADQLIEDVSGTPPDQSWISIAPPRTDGTIVVAYAGATDGVKGGDKQRVDYNIRSFPGGAWGGPIALDAAGDIHYGNPNCVLGTNDGVHMVWQQQSATTDPPAAWATLEGRTLNSVDSLSTTSTGIGDVTSSNLIGIPHAITYDDGGTQQIILNGFPGNAQNLHTAQCTEDGSDDISLDVLAVESFTTHTGAFNGEITILSYVELGGELHLVFSGGGGSAPSTELDVYSSKSTDNGTSWDTAVEEIDAITCNFISANIYARAGDTVLAYVYDDGGTTKYNEKVLIPSTIHVITAKRSKTGIQVYR